MDPVTIIGLLGSITNLVCTSKSTLELTGQFMEGKADSRTLSSDLSLFAEALTGFERVLRSYLITI